MAQVAAAYLDKLDPQAITVPGADAPVKSIDVHGLVQLGQNLSKLFEQYRSDRVLQEQRWLRNLRQYLGYYDPEIERTMADDRSKAYPKITRVKCISMLARIMDLMFPSDDRNWTITARPSPDMKLKDVQEAIQKSQQRDKDAGQDPAPLTNDYIQSAVNDLASDRAKALMTEIDDQLEEIGGDQSYDYVALNKELVASGIVYGIGVLTGPFAREVKTSTWEWDEKSQMPRAKTLTRYMPQFDFLRCWDFYPDMSATRLEDGDGYFTRKIVSKRQLRDLCDQEYFFESVIKNYMSSKGTGNYKPQTFESELRGMGIKAVVNDQKAETAKYEILIWHGPIDGKYLEMAGIEVADDKLSDMIDAEVWLLDGHVIMAKMNPWVELGQNIKTCHVFLFDHDDTAPIGFGLPNIMRDTQMSVASAVRMMLDNASVTCGPMLEVNTALMQAGQDLTSIHAYKTWYRDDEGATAQFPAIREIKVDGHLKELEGIVELFLKFADMETFVSPVNGGDQSTMPSEPMRSAPGASMMLGHAALPFKDIIRNFDRLTQSVIQALIGFNRALNPTVAQAAEYDAIARGATSLLAKELRGQQIDSLVTSLTPEEKIHADMRKLTAARFAVRDLTDMMVSDSEASRRQTASDQAASAQQDLLHEQLRAEIRNVLAQAYKNMTQGQKNMATASSEQVDTALDVMERDTQALLTHAKTINTHAQTAATLATAAQPGADPNANPADSGGPQDQGDGSAPNDPGGPEQPGPLGGLGAALPPGGPGTPGAGLMLPPGLAGAPGPGPGPQVPA